MRMGIYGEIVALCVFGIISCCSRQTIAAYDNPGYLCEQLNGNWDMLKRRQLSLSPVPKMMEFTGNTITLAGDNARKIAVVLDKNSERGNIAANEIISKIGELAPTAKAIVSDKPVSGAYNIVIQNRFPNDFHKINDLPGDAKSSEQAYVLLPNENGIVLAGNGEIGMLYAAVTARGLFGKKDGESVFYPAKIIDWPDFKRRQVGDLRGIYHTQDFRKGRYAEQVRHMKRVMDFLFRLKINSVMAHTIYLGIPFSPFRDLPYTEQQLQQVKEINDYANARGIASLIGTNTSLGRYPEDKDNPEVKEMLFYKTHKEYHSWARHDLHRKKAERIVEFCRKTGTRQVFLHSLDGGGIQAPELWSERDRATREKYGDDRSGADADMANIYVDVLNKNGVRCLVVQYPYTVEYFTASGAAKLMNAADTPGNREMAHVTAAKLSEWLREIDKKLRPDALLSIREASKGELDKFRALMPGRAVWYYWLVSRHTLNTCAMAPLEIRTVGSSFAPGRANDILTVFVWGDKFREQTYPVTAEYMWNTAFPGSKDLDREGAGDHGGAGSAIGYGERFLEYDAAAMDILAEKAAVGLWGDKAGQDLKALFKENLSLSAIVDPRETIRNIPGAEDYLGLAAQTRHAVRTAEKAMDKVWAKVKAGDNAMDDFSYPYFVQYYSMIKAGKAYADVNDRLETADTLIRKGELDSARKELDSARKELAADRTEYEKTMAELKNEPFLIRWEDMTPWDRSYLPCRLTNPDFAALAEKIETMDREKETIFQKFNVPVWFVKSLKTFEIFARRSDAAIRVDGRLDEKDWAEAVPVSHFIEHDKMVLLDSPAIARFLLDKDFLYLGFKAKQKLIGRIQEPKRGADERGNGEMIEWFVTPDVDNPREIWQLAVDTAGNLYTQKFRDGKSVRGVNFNASVAVTRGDDEWSCEIAAPFAAFGRAPDNKWRTLVGYNHLFSLAPRQVGTYATIDCGGQAFIERIVTPLRFSERAYGAGDVPKPVLSIRDVKTRDVTHTRGAGTLVTFNSAIETAQPVSDIVLTATFRDAKGKSVGMAVLTKQDYLPLFWSRLEPENVQLEQAHDALTIELKLTYRDILGAPRETTKSLPVGDIEKLVKKNETFPEGAVNNGRGFDGTCYFDASGALSMGRGTLDFWAKPKWDGAEPESAWGGEDASCFFHYGPVRRDSPASTNYWSLALWRSKTGKLNFRIANENYDSRVVTADIRDWKKGQWRRVTCVWDLETNGKSDMDIYIDGEKASGAIVGNKSPGETAMKIKPAVFTAQLGCVNSGASPAETVFDELSISAQSSRGDVNGAAAGLKFSFENDLVGYSRALPVSARLGSASTSGN